MAGIENILNMIDTQQKQTESEMIAAAKKKSDTIAMEGVAKAQKAYEEQSAKLSAQLERDYENACISVDADMKRKLLAFRVECIDRTLSAVIEKLESLPDEEYFSVLEKLAGRKIRGEKGIIQLGKRDLERLPSDFESRLNRIAEQAGGSIEISKEPADTENGFILTYGLISENCGFKAIIEAEREGVRDIAARILFG